MSKGEYLSIQTKDASEKMSLSGEKRIYYPFDQIDFSHPYRLIVTEMPPHSIQPYHAHKFVTETTIVLKGEAKAFEIEKDNQIREININSLSIFDPEIYNFETIVSAEDGTLLFVLFNKITKNYCGGELPYSEGYTADLLKYHTIENDSNSITILATVKSTTSDMLSKHPEIFNNDKILL